MLTSSFGKLFNGFKGGGAGGTNGGGPTGGYTCRKEFLPNNFWASAMASGDANKRRIKAKLIADIVSLWT
jgi:hypothetical protein